MNSTNAKKEIDIQRNYYANTARNYNAMHVDDSDANAFAMSIMFGSIDHLGVKSILDVGAGAGRIFMQAKKYPDLQVKGIEPVRALREIGYESGISPMDLIDGDGLALPFEDGAFDLVCEYAMLHHVRNPELVIEEMLRVAKKAVFISDSNGFGQGTFFVRSVKQAINMFGMWPLANWIKTRGRGYSITEGDGLAYSYSVFNNYEQIRQCCKSVYLFNTSPGGVNPYRTAGSVGLLGIKNCNAE